MGYKRILTVQDISCVGQCSLTVALPVLSVCGHETAVLPSSVLSNHTTGFGGYTFRDLSDDMPSIKEQWQKENINFSAIYTGYMGNEKQIDNVIDIMDGVLTDDAVIVVDPAMADGGELYPGFDGNFVQYMKKLVVKADYLLPNLTEACLLTGTPYTEEYNQAFIISLCEKLKEIGCKNIVFTGVSYSEGTTGVVTYTDSGYSYYCHQKIGKGIPGTGDLFASVFTGALLNENTVADSAKTAADFVLECIQLTHKYENHRYGPVFEPLLYKLGYMTKEG